MSLRLVLGLPPQHRRAAAQLYWQAFGGKLNQVMGPEPRALAYLMRVIRPDHAIVALEGDRLLGLAGFKTWQGAFAGGGFDDLRAVYGLPGALWRSALLWCLQREIDNTHLLLDGICVDRSARSTGIGTALLAAICAEARQRGYPGVRLDVIDTNWRARALYERNGFVVTGTQRLGPLRHVFGFAAATTMVRQLG
ncbi:GNAT family N-acetyltransferase [Fertoebacter nigrum]|uniref:GNAT family N-acetyltransferase n=1 Tax=Fertoeibacter niger TaxID=2656921 RepID=A0A8X8GUU5_9RHOB|nr:GNAT family N-acetyltransferase [Fertoeibacter niger]NUB44748.1 GNAT family N-acetyltransferase [Fertoeibacter niger]